MSERKDFQVSIGRTRPGQSGGGAPPHAHTKDVTEDAAVAETVTPAKTTAPKGGKP